MRGQSIFLSKVGSSSLMRVVEFFIEGRELDYSQKDIKDNTPLSKNTVTKIIKQLLAEDYIFVNRKVGRTNLYQLNADSPYIKNLIEIFDLAVKEEIREMFNRPQATGHTKIKGWIDEKLALSKPFHHSCIQTTVGAPYGHSWTQSKVFGITCA